MADDFFRHNSADEDKRIAAQPENGRYFQEVAGRALEVQYDQYETNSAYFGEAAPGAGTDEAVWRIRKIVTTSAGSVITSYADSTALFDKAWDDRASYSY